ncbi:uncharacterized protein LOC143460256 isoform X1 [Clavelina lepadiformis]|uniref:uncharacterized protein LOC143460256 isoform X1 n=2 Tax=Clavelina lepadiformis TaxID=159417 RepID=UPI0040428B27
MNSNKQIKPSSKLLVQKPTRSRSVSPRPQVKVNSNRKVSSSVNPKATAQDEKLTPVYAKEPTTIINQTRRINLPPKLLLVSSRCKYAAILEKSVNPEVVVVLYNYDTITFDSLLALVCASLDPGQRISSVACMMTCKPNGMFMVHLNNGMGVLGTATQISATHGPGQFFKILFEKFVDTSAPQCRLDLLAVGCQPGSYLQDLQLLIDIPVHISKEMFGSDTHVELPDGTKTTIGEIYFKPDKLRNWNSGTYQTIDLFEKIRMVGKGAFGTAVLYRKKDDNSLVVLKEINMTELNSQERLMAINETKVLAMLNHPNIICYYDTFEDHGVLMIEMEYADDGTLAQYLAKQDSPLEEKTVVLMFNQIVCGIAYMHKQSILHRDLKTSNIFLTTDGIVKISDFGLSKVMTSKTKVANTVLGTPYYISPEICEGKPYGEKSDIWALGCILYELAMQQRTFEGTNLPALVNKIINGQIAPIRGGYSAELRKLVKEMLSKEPEQRPTAEAIQAEQMVKLLAPFSHDERPHFSPGSRGSSERKQNEGTRSVLYLYNIAGTTISPIEGFPSKIKIRQVAVGKNHVVVVAMERVVYTWGDNHHGQLGHGHFETIAKPKPVDALKGKSVISAGCGDNFSVFLSDNGITMTCGDGSQGCLGHGNCDGLTRPKLVESLLSIDVTTVACGSNHVVVLGDNGEMYSWGCGDHGRLGIGTEENAVEPMRVNVTQPIRDVRCGHDATIFITAVGTLLACGNNKYNKLGLNERTGFLTVFQNRLKKTEVEFRKTPTATVKSIKGVVDVAMGRNHTAVLTDHDHVCVLGSNKEGQMGSGGSKAHPSPFHVKSIKDHQVLVIACGDTYTAAGTSNGILLYWGTRFGNFTSSSSGGLLQPPGSDKGHRRTMSTTSTLSVRSCSSCQPDSAYASECISRSSSFQDISMEENDSENGQPLNQSQTSDSRLPEVIYDPVPILDIRSPESQGDLTAYLDNLIPFRENIFIVVETNAPISSQSSIKEKKVRALKNRGSMQSLKVPYVHQSVSSNDSSEASDLSSTPKWLKEELEEARKEQVKDEKVLPKKSLPSKSSPVPSSKHKWNNSQKTSPTSTTKSSRLPRKISSAKSDSSSDSSTLNHLTVESTSKGGRRSSFEAPRRGRNPSPRRSPLPKTSNRLEVGKTPARRNSAGRSPIRSSAQMNEEIERLAKEKKESDMKFAQLKKEHEDLLKRMQENHEKEKFEQEQKLKDEISLLREELNILVKKEVESGRKVVDRSVQSKFCILQ